MERSGGPPHQSTSPLLCRMMSRRFHFLVLRLCIAALVASEYSSRACAALDATIEVVDPYETWLEGERWGVYIKVTNTGDEPFPLLFHPDVEATQIFITPQFETPPPNPAQPRLPPLPGRDGSRWQDVKAAASRVGFVLDPGEAFVYGPEAFITTEGLFGLGARRMSSYRINFHIGDGKIASSPEIRRNFIVKNEAWENRVIGEVKGASAEVTIPLRMISIDGVTWLFEGRARLCILPEGATPRFSTIDNREFVKIEFEGVDEEPVVVSNRFGHPISGSERTVPHLHLWKSLTSRPMGAATPDTRPEKATAAPTEEEPARSSPQPNAASPSEAGHSTGSPVLWITLGVGAVILAGAAWLRRHRAG